MRKFLFQTAVIVAVVAAVVALTLMEDAPPQEDV